MTCNFIKYLYGNDNVRNYWKPVTWQQSLSTLQLHTANYTDSGVQWKKTNKLHFMATNETGSQNAQRPELPGAAYWQLVFKGKIGGRGFQLTVSSWIIFRLVGAGVTKRDFRSSGHQSSFRLGFTWPWSEESQVFYLVGFLFVCFLILVKTSTNQGIYQC